MLGDPDIALDFAHPENLKIKMDMQQTNQAIISPSKSGFSDLAMQSIKQQKSDHPRVQNN